MELKDALRRFRQGAGLKQEDVAAKIGIMRQAYQPYETGKVTPSASMIIKIATTFNVSADYLLGLSDEPRPTPPKSEDAELIEAVVAFQNAQRTFNEFCAKRGIGQ